MTSPRVILLVGLSGSGKSTFAEKSFAKTEVLSTDAFREQLTDSRRNLDVTQTAYRLLLDILHVRCSRRLTTVVDSTGLDLRFRGDVRRVASLASIPVDVLLLRTPVETCLEQNARRPVDWQVHESVILDQWRSLPMCLTQIEGEGYRQIEGMEEGAMIKTDDLHVKEERTERKAFISMPIVENLTDSGMFRPERRAFYEGFIEHLEEAGIRCTSGPSNEGWMRSLAPPKEFTKFDIDSIRDCDFLFVVTTTRLSLDIFLEIGLAVALQKEIHLFVPESVRLGGMLGGLVDLGQVKAARFASEEHAIQLLREKLRLEFSR